MRFQLVSEGILCLGENSLIQNSCVVIHPKSAMNGEPPRLVTTEFRVAAAIAGRSCGQSFLSLQKALT
jgi:hypothetical protein